MKLYIVPWNHTSGIVLRIYTVERSFYNDYEVQITTRVGQMIAVRILNETAKTQVLRYSDWFGRVICELELDEADGLRILKVLKGIGTVRRSRDIPTKLLDAPLRELELFAVMKYALEGREHE